MLYLSSFPMLLLIAFFAEESLGYVGNLRKTEFQGDAAITMENIQPEDQVFWKRALSMSTDQEYNAAYFDTSAGDLSASCGKTSCASDSDCGGICTKCWDISAFALSGVCLAD